MVLFAVGDQVEQIRQGVIKQLSEADCIHEALIEDASNIQRYFRASGGDMATCIKRLVASSRWRRETKPSFIECQACLKDSRSHYLHL